MAEFEVENFLGRTMDAEIVHVVPPRPYPGIIEPCREYRSRNTEEATIPPEVYGDYNNDIPVSLHLT